MRRSSWPSPRWRWSPCSGSSQRWVHTSLLLHCRSFTALLQPTPAVPFFHFSPPRFPTSSPPTHNRFLTSALPRSAPSPLPMPQYHLDRLRPFQLYHQASPMTPYPPWQVTAVRVAAAANPAAAKPIREQVGGREGGGARAGGAAVLPGWGQMPMPSHVAVYLIRESSAFPPSAW